MSRAITPKQSAVLEFIKTYLADHGYPPTCQDIASGFGFLAVNAAFDHVNALCRKGYLEKDAGKFRGLRVIAQGEPA